MTESARHEAEILAWQNCPVAKWCIRQATGNRMTFACLGAMFLIHPEGRSVAEWN